MPIDVYRGDTVELDMNAVDDQAKITLNGKYLFTFNNGDKQVTNDLTVACRPGLNNLNIDVYNVLPPYVSVSFDIKLKSRDGTERIVAGKSDNTENGRMDNAGLWRSYPYEILLHDE